MLRQSLREQRQLMTGALPNQLLRTGYRAFSATPIEKRQLPREATWTWRQSSGTVVERFEGGISAALVKLSSRRSKSATTRASPSYKVWLAELSQNGVSCMWFLWVERGVPRTVSNATYGLLAAEAFPPPAAQAPLPTLYVRPFGTLSAAQTHTAQPSRSFSPTAAAADSMSPQAPAADCVKSAPAAELQRDVYLPQLSETDITFLKSFL